MTARTEVVWRQVDHLAVVESEGRVAVLDLNHPADPPQILEASGAVIWKAVDGTRSISAVIASVAGDFGLPSTEVEGDVVRFLDALASAGLLESS